MAQFTPLLRKDQRPVRYLVVDDSVFARKNLIKMIELFGGEVAGEAGDGLTAIAEFNRSKPDIVLMDITMPQMEGIESVERIVRQHPDARIVMVSSVGYQENILAALLRKDNQPVRYLVVDDSVFARKNIIKMVQLFGGEIAGEAGDGLTAIAEFNRIKPDIVLMDITMPQMEGIEAAERIVQSHPEARIVMVSSVGYQENIVAALQRGARHFVQKPVKPEVLYEVIKYVLGEDGAVANAAGAGA